jgi:phosphatidylserine/phosphatidylglycerophosphate/cardiolipin synthase-like enzyme
VTSRQILPLIFWILFSATPVRADLKAFFSPKGGCESEIVRIVENTQKHLDVAVYSINNRAILCSLEKAKKKGVRVRILTDHVQAAGNARITLDLVKQGFDLRLHSFGRIMHNKFLIADDSRVMTGSFNWTQPAENVNEENCVEFTDPKVVSQFKKQFDDHLWIVNTPEKSLTHLNRIRKKVAARAVASRYEERTVK